MLKPDYFEGCFLGVILDGMLTLGNPIFVVDVLKKYFLFLIYA